MATLTLTAQDVNGDPLVSGANINIVNGSTSVLTFEDSDFALFTPQTGETVSINGGTPLVYEFLGYGDVRGDPLQHAAFIRVETSPGVFETFSIDMNSDGDQLPNLATGNTKLTVAGLATTDPERFPAPACFTPFSLIETRDGPVLIQRLRVGDMIMTRDNGLQPLRYMSSQTFMAEGIYAPVVFDTGAMGNSEPLIVSQQHGMLVEGWRAEVLLGQEHCLVPAIQLVNGIDIRLREGGMVTYMHLHFDRHEIVFGAGIPSESFDVGRDSVGAGCAGFRTKHWQAHALFA